MKSKFKKILSVIIIAAVLVGWYVSIFGAGSVSNLKDSLKYGLDINGGVYVVMKADVKGLGESKKKTTMDQTRQVLEKRVNAMGISEATVTQEGTDRIRVEMPGVKDAKAAIDRIGETAQLRFTLADGTEYLSGSDVKNAYADVDSQNGGYKITLRFTSEGQKKFAKITSIASSGKVTPTVEENGQTVAANAVVIWLDDEVLTAPVAEETINQNSCEITRQSGGLPKEEATETAALIRGGALPVSLTEVSSSVRTASIGANALDKSIVAGAIGLALVFVLMILVFNLLGLFADIALALYVLIVLWVMVLLDGVLTLPGIAGIVLGIGMAVDANVIIFARIKEEISLGRSIRSAVDQGFRHALVTVLDSQITTLIATVILYQLGSAQVKGFALTLMISIVVSIFTAVIVTQVFVGMLADSSSAKNTFFGCHEDGTPKKLMKKEFHFIRHRKKFYAVSAAVILCGLIFLGVRGFNYGIDFTGGTMIQMNMGKQVSTTEVKKTLKEFDLNPTIIYAGKGNRQIIIQTQKALNASGRDEVEQALMKKYDRKQSDVVSSEEIGPSIGAELRTNALRSILIAALGMLLYIIFRFKSWKYGVSAIAGIGHDVLVLIAVYTITQLTVNTPFIAAILTIVGYSINDTIVIFDRVRENSRFMRGRPTEEILDHSINQTLDRSIMTSLTTLISIIPLLVMVSSELMSFVFPLMIGVIVGTYSSIALCSPLYYELNRKSELSKYEQQRRAKERIEAKKKTKEKGKSLSAPEKAPEKPAETAVEPKAAPESGGSGEAAADSASAAAKKKKHTGGSKNKKRGKRHR